VALPDFLIIGAPKAGSTALHAALVQHPQLFLSRPKEPKFFLTDGRQPPEHEQRGPGDAHSAQEWVWRRDYYEGLFDVAPPGTLKGESTPFYLWDVKAHVRMREVIPDVKMIAVLRDPVERAYSNWTHLWSDGLETESDFMTALGLEEERVASGYAPFWRYRGLGLYGEQIAHLTRIFPREQLHILRYRELVEDPALALDTIADFLGVDRGRIANVPSSNVKTWVPDTRFNGAVRHLLQAGASVGAHFPPRVWREAQKPLLALLQRDGDQQRARLSADQRREIGALFADDIALLEKVTGESFQDWLGDSGSDTYSVRKA
jgi:Sulfotransferase family